MPDLDIIRSGQARGWGAACSLAVRRGDGAETITAVARALAGELRRNSVLGSSQEAFREEARRILDRRLLGPTRVLALKEVGIDEATRREKAILAALGPDIEHLYAQVADGRKPKARARARLSASETLTLPISTQVQS